ncbi:MAG: hypothetical protein AAF696_24895 [Bacteroidota bacterium]
MPAKAKYLSSGWNRFSRVTAAILGTYAATVFLHMAIADAVVDDTPVLLTSTFSTFMVWCGLMVMVFMIKKTWLSWAILLGIVLISSLILFM